MQERLYRRNIPETVHVPLVIENVAEACCRMSIRMTGRHSVRLTGRWMKGGNRRNAIQIPDASQKPGSGNKMVMKRVTDKDGRLLNVFCLRQNIKQKQKEIGLREPCDGWIRYIRMPLALFRLNLYARPVEREKFGSVCDGTGDRPGNTVDRIFLKNFP